MVCTIFLKGKGLLHFNMHIVIGVIREYYMYLLNMFLPLVRKYKNIYKQYNMYMQITLLNCTNVFLINISVNTYSFRIIPL